MKSQKLTFSICLPTYKGSSVLHEALQSVLNQKHIDFECIIGDDNNLDNIEEIQKTKKIIDNFHDKRIRYFKNKINLGYPANMKKIVSQAQNEIVFLMAQDDILSEHALKTTNDAFFLSSDIGAVTRPYFWFMKDINHPVRAILPPSIKNHTIMNSNNPKIFLPPVIESIGQLSGLAMRRTLMDTPIHSSHVFTCHIYPFLSIFKTHPIVFLKDFTVAVRIEESQSRFVSSIYDVSPTQQWLTMFDNLYPDLEHKDVKEVGRTMMLKNFVGLIQLKNYAKTHVLFNEIKVLLSARPRNVFAPQFWFYCILTYTMPRIFLRKLTDWYKNAIHAKNLPSIHFKAQR